MTVFLDSSGTGGLWLREAQSLRFATNSSEKMTILSGGNVGIGTNSPAYNLQLASASSTTISVIADAATSASVYFGDSASATQGRISYNNANDSFLFFTNALERMRINSGGNVGIGTTGPLTKLDVRGSTFVSGYLAGFDTSPQGNYAYRLTNDGANSFINVLGGNLGIGTTSPKTTLDITGSGNTAINSKGNLLVSSGGTATQVAETGGQISFGSWLNGDLTQPYPLAAIRGVTESSTTNNNRGALIFGTMDSNTTVQERMRITSGGELYVGHSSTNPDHGLTVVNPANGTYIQLDHINGTVSGSIFSLFRYNQSVIGSITQNGTSQVSFNISSDYRLKEDLKDFAGLDMVSKIPVYDFKWKVDGYRSYGVMAHELQEVLPDAVVGKKDAEEMQGVDYSKIVPLLVKSIQELKAEIDELKK